MANLRNPYQWEYPEGDPQGQPEVPYPTTEPPAPRQDVSTGMDIGQKDIYASAKGIYGDNWDADAQQQFQSRMSQGQSMDQILANTQDDYQKRFMQPKSSEPSGVSGQAMGPPQISMGPKTNPAVMAGLERLFTTGGYNQDIVNRRVESANESLQRQRKSQLATDRAALASRGLLSEGQGHESGPEFTALSKLDQGIADQYSGAVRDIYADEAGNADQRMMQALQIAAGLSASEAQMVIDQFRAETERQSVGNQFELGKGNLALGNMRGVNDYNLGLGRLGLDRDTLLSNMDNAQWDRLIEMVRQGMDLSTLAGGGYE